MSTDYDELKSQYPSVISADQFRQICHISKRKAKWLLENDIVPCNMPPPGIFSTWPSSTNANGVSMLPSADFLNNQWKQMPDVLRTEQVAHMLGYTKNMQIFFSIL